QRADRVQGGIANQLQPDLLPQACLHRRFEPGLHQGRRERTNSVRPGAVQLAQRKTVPLDVLHDSRLHQSGRRIGHAAEDALSGKTGRDHTARVHGLKGGVVRAEKEPPGNAILSEDECALLPGCRRKGRSYAGKAVRLERHEDHIGGGDGVQPVSAGWMGREGGVVRLQDLQAPLSHSSQMRPSGNQGDLKAGSGKASAQIATGGAGAHDGEFHCSTSFTKAAATCRRWILPVLVRGMSSTKKNWLGILKSARCWRQKSARSRFPTSPFSTTAAATSSPQVLCGMP